MSMHKQDYLNALNAGWTRTTFFLTEHKRFTVGLVCFSLGAFLVWWMSP